MSKNYVVELNDNVVKKLQDIVGSGAGETLIDLKKENYEYFAKKLKFIDEEGQPYSQEPTINLNVPRFISYLQSIGYDVDNVINYYNHTVEPSTCRPYKLTHSYGLVSMQKLDVTDMEYFFRFANDSGLFFQVVNYYISIEGAPDDSEYPAYSISQNLLMNKDSLESNDYAYSFSNILSAINSLDTQHASFVGGNLISSTEKGEYHINNQLFSLVDFDKFIDCFDIYNE